MQHRKPIPDDQDTVILRRGPLIARRPLVILLAGLGVLLVALTGWCLTIPVRPPTPASHPTPAMAVPLATEAEIAAHTAPHTTVFRFAANPRILVIDYASLREQGLMLNRIAAFVEKAGLPHDRVLDTTALNTAITQSGETIESYYYGHDYGSHDLTQFFALADRDSIRLDEDEERLRVLLHQVALFDSTQPGAVISLPQTSPDGIDAFTRRIILRHELGHGEFFSNPVYADFVRRFWSEALSVEQRAAFRHFLGGLNYDTANEELMLNEMQAFLMFTPDERYFTPGWIGASPAQVTALRHRFLATMPPGWLRNTAATPVPRRQRSITTRMALAETLAGVRLRNTSRSASRYAAAGSVSRRGSGNSRSRAAKATTMSVPESVATFL